MSQSSTSSVGLQPPLEHLENGAGTGYGVYTLTTEERPVYKNISNVDARKAAVSKLVAQVEGIVERFSDSLDVKEITIGKTFVERKATSTFSKLDSSTWAVKGISKRWDKYRNKGYKALIVFECIAPDDLPDSVKSFGFTEQDAALRFEDLVIKEVKKQKDTVFEEEEESVFANIIVANEDDGGGGRTKGSKAGGFVLYVALKYDEPVETKINEDECSGTSENSESEEEKYVTIKKTKMRVAANTTKAIKK